MTEREMVRALRLAGYIVLRPSPMGWKKAKRGKGRGAFGFCIRGHEKGPGACLMCRKLRDHDRHSRPEVKKADAKRKREARRLAKHK